MKQSYKFIWASLALSGLAFACSLSGSPSIHTQSTVQSLGTSVAGTVTAEAASNAGSSGGIQTAAAKATTILQSAEQTQAAMAVIGDEARAATSTAFAPIAAELPKYGVDPAQGRPGWIHPPVSLDINGKYQYDYANQFLATVARDFIVSADITWNTQYGGSGCGFVLRSDGNKEALNQYLVIATRGASGHVIFATMANGEVVGGRDIYAYGLDPEFDWHNDQTNRLTVVGRGTTFSIYTNGTKIGDVDPNDPLPQPVFPPSPEPPANKKDPAAMAGYAKKQAEYQTVVNQIRSEYNARLQASRNADKEFDRGFIAMAALAESGRTQCQFNNTWLWLIQ